MTKDDDAALAAIRARVSYGMQRGGATPGDYTGRIVIVREPDWDALLAALDAMKRIHAETLAEAMRQGSKWRERERALREAIEDYLQADSDLQHANQHNSPGAYRLAEIAFDKAKTRLSTSLAATGKEAGA